MLANAMPQQKSAKIKSCFTEQFKQC